MKTKENVMLTDERIDEIHPMVKDFPHWKRAFARAIEAEVLQAQEPCPNCQQSAEKSLEVCRLYQTEIDALRAKVAEQSDTLQSLREQYSDSVMDRARLSERIAEQSAEIERLRAHGKRFLLGRARAHASIAQQTERIAQQAALIEQCEKALTSIQEINPPLPIGIPENIDAALDTITAHKRRAS